MSPLIWLKGKPGLWGTCSSCLKSALQGNQAFIKEIQIPLTSTSIFPVNLMHHFVPRWRELNTAVTLKVKLWVQSCTWAGKGHFLVWSCNYTETSHLNTLAHIHDMKHFHKHVHSFYHWNALCGLFGVFKIKSLCKVFSFLIYFSLKVVGFFPRSSFAFIFWGSVEILFFKLTTRMIFLTSSNYKTQYLIASQTDGSQESVTGGG